MTERKPADITFTSWIDRQINEATERGAFDNLPGAGQPLPRRTGADATAAWLREYLRREGVSPAELLPTPLRLRKEIEALTGTVPELHSEQEVRELAAELNRQIIRWRRIPEGPPVYLPLVNEDMLVSSWREAHPPAPPAAPSPEQARPVPRWRWRRGRRQR
jgi:hypothetical protein